MVKTVALKTAVFYILRSYFVTDLRNFGNIIKSGDKAQV